MGARCTFVFKHSEDKAVALYSHWGEDNMYIDLAGALTHAAPRIEMKDAAYATRMAISFLLQDNLMDETGFGIYPCDPSNHLGLMDHPIVINFINNTVEDDTGVHSIDDFINYHMHKEEYLNA
jgi:hypothetical protein